MEIGVLLDVGRICYSKCTSLTAYVRVVGILRSESWILCMSIGIILCSRNKALVESITLLEKCVQSFVYHGIFNTSYQVIKSNTRSIIHPLAVCDGYITNCASNAQTFMGSAK
jgi:hypothetical protein